MKPLEACCVRESGFVLPWVTAGEQEEMSKGVRERWVSKEQPERDFSHGCRGGEGTEPAR